MKINFGALRLGDLIDADFRPTGGQQLAIHPGK
jgi:hypothetical protein